MTAEKRLKRQNSATTGGRPTDFRKEFVEQAKKLAQLGATDMEIADFFDVSVRTIHRWKIEQKEFCHSLKIAKKEADARVERALFQRAIGYERYAVKIFMPAGSEKPVYATHREVLPPDTTACIFWLKNRNPQEWRDKSEFGLEGELSLAELISDARKRVIVDA